MMKRSDQTWGYMPIKRAEPTPVPVGKAFVAIVCALILAIGFAGVVEGAITQFNYISLKDY
tara:strand:- start:2420 stop:2602 length:183 start_codon:yes stop_codon:yes gene_type:complete